MPESRFRKMFWDLGWGGHGMDALFVLFAIGAIAGGAIGGVFDAWLTGAGIGGLIGVIAFAALVVWAHWGRTSPDRKH